MSKKTKLTDLDPTVVSEVFTRRVAILAVSGKTAKQIGDELGFSAQQITHIQRGDQYKKLVAHMGEQELAFAASRGKTQMAGMVDDAMSVMRKVMKDYLGGKGSARDAVTVAQTVNRGVGIEKSEDKQNDTQLTVILPGGAEPVTYEVKAEEPDEA